MARAPRAAIRKLPRWLRVILVVAAVGVVAGSCGYRYISSGGLVARQRPSSGETFVAGKLLDLSIPRAARDEQSPLAGAKSDVLAGRALYQSKCESCHGSDGLGNTETAAGLYPPPHVLVHHAIGDGAPRHPECVRRLSRRQAGRVGGRRHEIVDRRFALAKPSVTSRQRGATCDS